jgi:hypothetical protein
MKTADILTVGDFQEHPVWRFGRGGDTVMVPVSRLPCTTLGVCPSIAFRP